MTRSLLRVMVVGSGGREHALAEAISKSPNCAALYVVPGNDAMPGIKIDLAVNDLNGIRHACRSNDIRLVVIGPEAALEAGLTDTLLEDGVAVFGPIRDCARLEWSKSYTREVADRIGIPSPASASFAKGDTASAIAWWKNLGKPVVVKAAGLAAGKGVLVPLTDREIEEAIKHMVHDTETVLEERLTGPEYSLIAMCDGTRAIAFPLSQDHKRIGEGDRGANTGGMGAYAPAPAPGMPSLDELVKTFIQPTLDYMASIGKPYRGALYAGLMNTPDGPKLLEYNCRFGDPEAQVLLPLLQEDLLPLLFACANGNIASDLKPKMFGAALGVVLASEGYPEKPRTGKSISGLEDIDRKNSFAYHAGTVKEKGVFKTAGGRVLTVVGTGIDLIAAREAAYAAVEKISFERMQMRRDIGWRARGAMLTSYAATGVDIDEGAKAVDRMKSAVEATHGANVLRGVGSFGGSIDVSALKDMEAPVLVASTDGVGTKVEVAARTGRYRGVGMDIVNHCIDDVLVQGARPMFFLDYVASSKLKSEMVAEIVEGMAEACSAAGCALLGGETAEMPGVYHDGAFDIAGTLVGVVDKAKLLPSSPPQPGDVLIGVASNGPHTNGYSLLRKAFEWMPLDTVVAPLQVSLADALLEPHRNYLPVLDRVLREDLARALVHITGGGLPDNMPRVLPAGVRAQFDLGSWPVPPLFQLAREILATDTDELYRTLNMGIGMVLVVEPHKVSAVQAAINETTWVIGRLIAGERGVELT